MHRHDMPCRPAHFTVITLALDHAPVETIPNPMVASRRAHSQRDRPCGSVTGAQLRSWSCGSSSPATTRSRRGRPTARATESGRRRSWRLVDPTPAQILRRRAVAAYAEFPVVHHWRQGAAPAPLYGCRPRAQLTTAEVPVTVVPIGLGMVVCSSSSCSVHMPVLRLADVRALLMRIAGVLATTCRPLYVNGRVLRPAAFILHLTTHDFSALRATDLFRGKLLGKMYCRRAAQRLPRLRSREHVRARVPCHSSRRGSSPSHGRVAADRAERRRRRCGRRLLAPWLAGRTATRGCCLGDRRPRRGRCLSCRGCCDSATAPLRPVAHPTEPPSCRVPDSLRAARRSGSPAEGIGATAGHGRQGCGLRAGATAH